MKIKTLFLISLMAIGHFTFSQTYPTFGSEVNVTITGLTFDAMEPFISVDDNTLFFNSINSGGNTNLYYATKVNDSTFTYIGLVGGCYDPSPNHLDAVASIDSTSNFFWVSLRSIPNLYRGNYFAGNVSNISKVYGNFNILNPGWIIMDAAIHYQGNLLYYSNAYFGPTYTECIGIPCQARLGVAQKINDSTFNKLGNSDGIFSYVNDTNYLVYAPQVTQDGLELYYTRLLKGSFNTEICVSIRNSTSDTFSLPQVIYSSNLYFPEAASPSTDKQKIYYHKKDTSQKYCIYLRYRTGITSAVDQTYLKRFGIYPNPTSAIVNISLPSPVDNFTAIVYSALGQELVKTSNNRSIDISNLAKGIYLLKVEQKERSWTTKISKE